VSGLPAKTSKEGRQKVPRTKTKTFAADAIFMLLFASAGVAVEIKEFEMSFQQGACFLIVLLVRFF
jgi:hypothetical protein